MSQFSTFNYSQNRDKAIANLINIIEGMTCDGKVSEKEMIFLDTWLLESEVLSQNYYVNCIREKISDILSDGRVEQSELDDLKELLLEIQRGLMDTPNIDLYSTDSDKHLLEGLCKGMASDYNLSDEEISYLNWFLSTNTALKNNYPGKHLYSLVQSILSDGIITEDERASLLEEITAFTGSNISEGIVDGYSTTSPVDLVEQFYPENSKVCLTGKFLCGSRRQCEADLIKLGCTISDRVTQDLDYLIIGALSSKDWKFQSFGRKIEQAIDYRDNKGVPLKILSEEHWQTLMRDNNSLSQ
ncbi:BRCT domain-containing protein [Edwardsiella tarda]|uniref:BRCT domain-containing protein n=1 Tax=Edwardsiella tarda TaxID=636 RepID=UPI00083A1A65|nr:BRCT domain-containing protein [Edwardsiella tarda]